MLDVAYKAVDDLPPGRLARIDEDRGRIRILLDQDEPLPDVVRQLNIEVDNLMIAGNWFQLWGDEIISRDTPGCPLRVRYLVRDWVPGGPGLKEDRGVVSVYINPRQTVKEFAAAMNPITKKTLDAGRWFQLYAGEIIDAAPEELTGV